MTFWLVTFRYPKGTSNSVYSVLAASKREAYAKTFYRFGHVTLLEAIDLCYGA